VSQPESRSWLDRLVSRCFSFLLAAVALYVGVQLILAVWHVLLSVLVVIGVGMALAIFRRSRSQGW
jgi:hypothetical protein